MFALAAVIAFAIAFILHRLHAGYVTDAELLGFLFVALHLLWPVHPWRRPPAT